MNNKTHLSYKNSQDSKHDVLKTPFVRFDNSRFLQTIQGPSRFSVLVLIFLSVIGTYLCFNYKNPREFCQNPETCFKCPPFTHCHENSLVCVDGAYLNNGFCVIPGSLEEQAMKYFKDAKHIFRINKSITENDICKYLQISSPLAASLLPYLKYSTVSYSKPLIFASLLIWIVSFCSVLLHYRSKNDHKVFTLVLGYLESSPPRICPIDLILSSLRTEISESAKIRILKMLNKVPQLDVNFHTNTVFKRI